ncbi:MAG: M48 family metallopeptidase [Flavobacteriales bacterium]|nr:M48 family metallopeptidase [Flavobacteriales bacterium]
MKKAIIYLVIVAFAIACTTVPITGRKQMNLLPESQMMSMSLANYNQFLGANPTLPASDQHVQQVKRVGEKIAAAATRYLKAKGASDRVAGFKWDFNVVQSNEVNAWCMPGGKVVFYTGILPVCQDEDGIAVVMGHEVAHAIARHGNERMSQGLLVQGGGMAVDLASAMTNQSAQTTALFQQAYGIGATVGAILPFSRLHESEADEMGLIFTAMAGYDPATAVPFWERMSKLGGSRPPEFLSTHPDPEKRSQKLAEQVRLARAYGIKYGTN